MRKGEFTRESVLKAIDEYDRVGQETFLTTYGYRPARDYLLVHDAKEYDSKAIAGVAHRYEYGQALGPHAFHGGLQEAVAWLKRAGFEVKSIRNPDWVWDEILLACAITADNGWKGLGATDPRVIEVSELLQLMPIHDLSSRNDTFRNNNGVARKTFDIATHHPDYTGKPTNGGARDVAVLKAFLDSPLEMAAAAELVRAGILSGELRELPPADEEADEFDAPEGRLLVRKHFARERNRGLRQRKINAVLGQGSRLACEVCDFDFQRAYGDRGMGYIECHHVVPLHEAGEGRTKLSDLALICANCHRMVHRRAPWPTPQELRALMARQRP
ncbi:5-methylcytosine-specific restriction protein A [Kitasatospora gansuensis]|uniref:5-methylcytosine-specific restriction protein A n=1 Tax=Kitasatospora gansuensis TaxID=258050 RepID=A0A7W7WIP9_9ACTN|nr:HNH endonuclease [Kitasatospora gansuensis]MBB4948418.1 5-methylcytosine-specific restriction protein A [Kitasatospora gansuensis]